MPDDFVNFALNELMRIVVNPATQDIGIVINAAAVILAFSLTTAVWAHWRINSYGVCPAWIFANAARTLDSFFRYLTGLPGITRANPQ